MNIRAKIIGTIVGVVCSSVAISADAQNSIRDVQRINDGNVLSADKSKTRFHLSGNQIGISPDGNTVSYPVQNFDNRTKKSTTGIFVRKLNAGKEEFYPIPALDTFDFVTTGSFLERSEVIGTMSVDDAQTYDPAGASQLDLQDPDLREILVAYNYQNKSYQIISGIPFFDDKRYFEPEVISRSGRFLATSIPLISREHPFEVAVVNRDTGEKSFIKTEGVPFFDLAVTIRAVSVSDDGSRVGVVVNTKSGEPGGKYNGYIGESALYLFNTGDSSFKRIDTPSTCPKLGQINTVLFDATNSSFAISRPCGNTQQIFYRGNGRPQADVVLTDNQEANFYALSLSPNGRYIIVGVGQTNLDLAFGEAVHQKYGHDILIDTVTSQQIPVTRNRDGVIAKNISTSGISVSDEGTVIFGMIDSDYERLTLGPVFALNDLRFTGPVLNGVDKCPTDNSKVHPGRCGCGVMESDKDFDGTLECGGSIEIPGQNGNGNNPEANPPASTPTKLVTATVKKGVLVCQLVTPTKGKLAITATATTGTKTTKLKVDTKQKKSANTKIFSVSKVKKGSTLTCNYNGSSAAVVK